MSLDIYNLFFSEIVSTQSWLPHFLEKDRYDTYEDFIDLTNETPPWDVSYTLTTGGIAWNLVRI